MPYFNVSVPLKLKILTYHFNKDIDLTGFAVQVPLKNRVVDGIVIKKLDKKPDEVPQTKEIHSIIGEAYNKKFIEFLKWMSFYYISEIGSVVRSTFFEEVIHLIKGKNYKRTSKKQSLSEENTALPQLESCFLNNETLSKIIDTKREGQYKTFLIHCPNFFYEMKLMLEVVTTISSSDGTILLVLPEIKDAQKLFNFLKGCNIQAVLLHSEMKRAELLSSIKEIIEDKVKVIVGTRFAVFAPVKKLSLIMLAQESSWLYKAEETPRYHARDCAVMRGFIECCPVVLTDFMPSTTSYYNALRGKYELIDDFNQLKHPDIKILRQPYQTIFHPEVLLYLKLYHKEGILVTSPRSGYSLIRCSECREVIKCEQCGYSMVFHKSSGLLECFRCNRVIKMYEQCPYCMGVDIHPVGVGVERIIDELKQIFSKKQTEINEIDLNSEKVHGICVGQAGKIKTGYHSRFKGAIILDFDFFISIPDYRTLENAFARVLSISQLVKENGSLFIQTRNPTADIFKFIRSYNFKDFYLYELKHRKETDFPPFSRIVKLMVKLKKTGLKETLDKLKEFLKTHITGEVIGPLKHTNTDEFVFILRSKDKRKLTEDLTTALGKLINFKEIAIKVEVDPVSLKI
ncbi:MAG TPA: hypothetical protein PKZ17_02540 [Thermodesulfovibrio thiophilus]|uniref:primosomal protein N' family DNA-binding protein n=1 Tax=Thermodesulfovibrio thiophilus TaxID=340095 RepID=UPI001828609A|nr:hypothetical protein [Thermodesulfovibrio thiophilus]HHW19532.1 hypothetical protein [Thermodesulfovibrio thiophilus]HOA82341.1 hypothetical protein [Thermodesulfovibrio thiophilus]HQA03599.1 hypothetical protein [Thermodesulfovibrio thiophilus]HQD35856.1 hypothetical protein [Thermodesulfovibrio thiophilus]